MSRPGPANRAGTQAKTCVQLLKLSKDNKSKFFSSFDTVITNCDGVLWLYADNIPDAGRGILALKQAGKDCKFISNNNLRTFEDYLAKLSAIGLANTNERDVMIPVKVLIRYIKHNLAGKKIFSLCSPQVNRTLESNGIKVQTMKPALNLAYNNIINTVIPKDKVDAVIFDLNFNITFGELAMASEYLKQSSCSLLIGATESLIPITNDFNTLGCSGFNNILQEVSGKEAILFGKPGQELIADLFDRYRIKDASRVLYICDNVFSDIDFAKKCGFQTLLVLTGTSSSQDIENASAKPNYVTQSAADFIKFFEGFKENDAKKKQR